MTKFVGRKPELQKLRSLFDKRSASLIVIRGRRRVGKSRLLEEFSHSFQKSIILTGIPPSTGTTAESQREEFARQLALQVGTSDFKKNDWGDLFWCLAQHSIQGRVLVVLDEISWMGSKDTEFLGKLKVAWDLYFSKNDQLILAICGSASTWIEKNILSSTAFLGRESLDLIIEELSINDCTAFWNAEDEKVSAHEKLMILAVTGGIPRYLEHINPTLSAEENISRMCFDKTGILFNEFEKIFFDLFSSKNVLYKKIVNCLVDGLATQETLSKKLKMQTSGLLSDSLNDLITSGFISRDYTWHIKDGLFSRLSHYRLKDNYSRFYLKYILPNRSRIKLNNIYDLSFSNLAGWYTIMGLQVENLILSNRHLIKNALQINPNDIVCDNPFFQRKTNRQAGCQIDYLIQTKYNTLYICEIKYSKNPIGMQIIDEVREKINRLSKPHHFSYRAVLIHINGVSEQVEESQFFSKIICFSDFLKKEKI